MLPIAAVDPGEAIGIRIGAPEAGMGVIETSQGLEKVGEPVAIRIVRDAGSDRSSGTTRSPHSTDCPSTWFGGRMNSHSPGSKVGVSSEAAACNGIASASAAAMETERIGVLRI